MKNYQLLLAALLTLSFSSQAQTSKTSIRGIVNDPDKKEVNAATVSLLHSKDSSVAKMTVTDASGKFSFEGVEEGPYLVSVSAVGYGHTYTESFQSNGKETSLPVIALKPVTKEMKAVTFVARKPMIEMKIDKMVVNVDAAVSNVGANALEVLEKSPGVQVDKDGNISLKGKQGVMILMDGRPTYLTGPELANLLKSMQASQLEQIEIMTNPPAKYDASGNSGVINIRTKKNKMKGFNGNLTAGIGQGSYFKNNESLSLNYKNGRLNLFSNYSFNRNINFQELDIFRKYKNDDKTTRAMFEQNSLMVSRRTNHNLKLGMDYNLTDKTILGFVFSGFISPESEVGNNTSFLMNPERSVDSIVQSTSRFKENWKNGSVNMNVRHQFDSTGREITADIDYIRYSASNEQHFINNTFTPNWIKKYEEQLTGNLPSDINIYSAKVDYTHPLNKESKLETGIKSSYVSTVNKANYFEMIEGEWETDYRKTNYFDYKERINAAYVSLNSQLSPKWGIQAGLRYEHTSYEGFQYGNPMREDSTFKKSYGSLFPTAYLSFKGDKNNQFGLSVGRRIDRPRYQNLNPFMFFLDKYTYGQGNPYLKPQYSNNIEFTHIFKQMLTTTLNYGITKNNFIETFDQPETNGEYNYATIVRQGNIGTRQNAGVAVNLQVPVGKWLNSTIYTNYNYSKFEGEVNGEMVNNSGSSVTVSLNNQLKFSKGWSGEIGGWYQSRGVWGQILINPMGQLNVGVSKQVLKGKGSLKLNVRDILYTQMPEGDINFKSTEAHFKNSRDTRVANLTFSYRFGKQFKGSSPRKKGGADEEANRVGAGN